MKHKKQVLNVKRLFYFFWLEHHTCELKGNKTQVFGNAHIFIY